MVLHGLKRRPAVVPGGQLHVVELVAVHGRRPQGPDLPGPDQVVEGLHGLLDGRLIVEPVDDVQIQIVGAQPLQRAVDLPENGLPGEPAGVKVHLGGNATRSRAAFLFSARPRYSSLVPAE